MNALELQAMLRRIEVLRNVNVGYESDFAEALVPHKAIVSGRVSLYGDIHAFETEIDLRHFQSEFDVIGLAKALVASFEDAAKIKGE